MNSTDYAITQGRGTPADASRPFRVIRVTDGYMSPKGPVGSYRIIEENLTAREALELLARLAAAQP